MSEPHEARYADPDLLVAEAFAALLPAERVDVATHAARRRWLANEGGGYVGRWQHELAPYLVGPMEALTQDHLTVAVAGPGQCGKTSIAENWFLQTVETDPADLLWYMQTEAGVAAYVKGRIGPMIDQHDGLKSRQGLRAVDDSLHYKRFKGCRIEFLSATASNLINKSAPRIVGDELDAYPAELGDVKVLLDVRRQTYGRESRLLAMSHPDRARGLVPGRDWTDGIMALYADSDRRAWWWPCPHCGAWSSPVPGTARHMALVYPEDAPLETIEREARLVCPSNGCLVEDGERRGMNLRGRWIGLGQEIAEDGTVTGQLAKRSTAGFWIVGVMSPFVLGGIGALARARAKALREWEAGGDEATLRQVVVKQWGIPYAPPRRVGSLDAAALADRAEPGLELGRVANGVRFLTAAFDVQASRFEILVRGWGVRGESWVVDHYAVAAETATDAEAWDRLIDALATVRYPLAGDPGRGMAVRAVGYDSGGLPGVTQQAYDAWVRARRRGLARLYGQVAGRDAWSILPLKGAAGLQAQRLAVVYPDTARKVQSGGHVPVATFNPNSFKDDMQGHLGRAEAGPWAVHVPAALRSPEPPHAFFEQLVAERRLPSGRWEKVRAGARNEAIDLMVMTHVVAHLHGLARLKWDAPPAWAAEWELNSAIGPTQPDAGKAGTLRPSAAAAPFAAARPAAAPPPRPPAPRTAARTATGGRRVTISSWMAGR